MPASALINLSHGNRSETGNQKLTAIVKPQPAVSPYGSYSPESFSQKAHLGGLNHSPRSLFVPTRHLNGRQHNNMKAENKGNSHFFQKGTYLSGNQKYKNKQDDEFCNIWQSLQSSGKSQSTEPNGHEKGGILPQYIKLSASGQYSKPVVNDSGFKAQQRKQESLRKSKEDSKDSRNEGQTHKVSSKSNFSGANKYNVKLLKRNEGPSVPVEQKHLVDGPSLTEKNGSELEDIFASLNIFKEKEVQSSYSKEPINEEHLSPQTFAMKGTQMLKEILKIDASDKAERKTATNEVSTSSSRQDFHEPASHHKHTKKMAAFMNKSVSTGGSQNTQVMETGGHPLLGQPNPLSTPVSELSHTCSLVGMLQPEFSFFRTPQTMTVCQVKLSNGLLVHGPQCHSENEAKEKAAFFALQQLSSFGMNFPLPLPPPPVFPNYQPMGTIVPPGSIPPVFTQHTANLFPSPSHAFGPVPWGGPVHGKPYYPASYPGNIPFVGTVPIGTHNQFIPLQVTKKRAASKINSEAKEFPPSLQDVQLRNEQSVSDSTKLNLQDVSSDPLRSPPQATQSIASFQEKTASQSSVVSRKKSTPNVSSKRKSRKLAVNFGAPKTSE